MICTIESDGRGRSGLNMPKQNLIITLFAILCVSTVNCGTSKFRYQYDKNVKTLLKVKSVYPDTSFIILTDIHYYETSLGTSGSEFQKYLDSDRKLLIESSEIFSVATKEISKKEVDFVIICGDLTKDGEKINHQAVAMDLKMILDSGKKIFVVPGNHDVSNGNSVQYLGDKTLTVPNFSKEEFEKIYKDFGYGAAIERDPSSLSYVAEPVSGLWLLALDSCRWKENKANHKPLTDGEFSEETLKWIENVLIESKKGQKAVIAFMHHGIWEHYPGNKKYYSRYIVADFEKIAKMLANYGVSLVFTGHFHAQDITLARFQDPESFIFDVETGSLVTYPCPYRIVDISSNQIATVRSRFIISIPSNENAFSEYAEKYCFDRSIKLVNAELKKYYVSAKDRNLINSQIAKALMVHLAGDEKKPETTVDTKGLGLWGKFIFSGRKGLIDGWYSDYAPSDNQVIIDLKNGNLLNGLK